METRFERNKALVPSQVYCAAIGMFAHQDYGFELLHIIKPNAQMNNAFPLTEIARVYKDKDDQIHILYAPAKDNTQDKVSREQPTLIDLISAVEGELTKLAELTERLAAAKRHFIICECGKIKTLLGTHIDAKHFVYATHDNKTGLTIIDSINKKVRDYDVSHIKKVFSTFEFSAGIEPKFIGHGGQPITNDWACGHHVLQAFQRDIKGTPHLPVTKHKISLKNENKILLEHSKYFDIGNRAITPTSVKPENPTGAPIDMKTDDIDAFFNESVMTAIAPLRPDLAPDHAPRSRNHNPHASFFSRPAVKAVAIAAGAIALGCIIAASVLTFGIVPIVLFAVGGALALASGSGLLGALINKPKKNNTAKIVPDVKHEQNADDANSYVSVLEALGATSKRQSNEESDDDKLTPPPSPNIVHTSIAEQNENTQTTTPPLGFSL